MASLARRTFRSRRIASNTRSKFKSRLFIAIALLLRQQADLRRDANAVRSAAVISSDQTTVRQCISFVDRETQTSNAEHPRCKLQSSGDAAFKSSDMPARIAYDLARGIHTHGIADVSKINETLASPISLADLSRESESEIATSTEVERRKLANCQRSGGHCRAAG